MDYLRIELDYGDGALDRFDVVSKTRFFHERLITARVSLLLRGKQSRDEVGAGPQVIRYVCEPD